MITIKISTNNNKNNPNKNKTRPNNKKGANYLTKGIFKTKKKKKEYLIFQICNMFIT